MNDMNIKVAFPINYFKSSTELPKLNYPISYVIKTAVTFVF